MLKPDQLVRTSQAELSSFIDDATTQLGSAAEALVEVKLENDVSELLQRVSSSQQRREEASARLSKAQKSMLQVSEEQLVQHGSSALVDAARRALDHATSASMEASIVADARLAIERRVANAFLKRERTKVGDTLREFALPSRPKSGELGALEESAVELRKVIEAAEAATAGSMASSSASPWEALERSYDALHNLEKTIERVRKATENLRRARARAESAMAPNATSVSLRNAVDELEKAERDALHACVNKAELTAAQIVLTDVRSRLKEIFVMGASKKPRG
jgi:hypothetical protein